MKKVLIILGLAVFMVGTEAASISGNSNFTKKCKVKYKDNTVRYKGRCERVITPPPHVY